MQILAFESQQIILRKILGEIEDAAMKGTKVNHTIVLGRRGSGKTTTLRFLYDSIQQNDLLKSHFNIILVPFSFNGKRLDIIVEQLLVMSDISSAQKPHLLFVDDIDLMLENSGDADHALRKILLRQIPQVSLIATADKSFREEYSSNKAFYGFLRELELKEPTDNDIHSLMKDISSNIVWNKLNEQLALTNTFWLHDIAGSNVRLLTVLKNIVFSCQNKNLSPDAFLKSYFELTGPVFLNEVMSLPKNNRYFLESASLLGRVFHLRELDLQIGNLSQEAIRLVNRGYLLHRDAGGYSFQSSPLKAWFRYVKNLPLGLVLNVDVDTSRSIGLLGARKHEEQHIVGKKDGS